MAVSPRTRMPLEFRRLLVLCCLAASILPGFACTSTDEDTAEKAATSSEAAVEPTEVAESFMNAWASGDGEAITATLPADAQMNNLDAETISASDAETISALHDWYRAQGWEYRNGGCDVLPAVGGHVVCVYTFENDLTRALDRKPVTGSFDLLIEDGAIKTVVDHFNVHAYDDIWKGFAAWLRRNHPDDLERMYTADGYWALLTPASIELWRRHTDEFITSGAVAVRP